MIKILVVDDDRTLADVVAFTLQREGYQVILAYDGKTALRRWKDDTPSLIILDVNLPGIDGFNICRQIREQSETPILLLTVRDEEDDIIHGLSLGADDYITKPFSPRQLVARTKAILRRTAGAASEIAIRKAGDLTLDIQRRELTVAEGEAIQLTALENRLLDLLMINQGQVMTIERIIDHVWGPNGGDRAMVRQLVHRLRLKIEKDPQKPVRICNIPGLGYELVVN